LLPLFSSFSPSSRFRFFKSAPVDAVAADFTSLDFDSREDSSSTSDECEESQSESFLSN